MRRQESRGDSRWIRRLPASISSIMKPDWSLLQWRPRRRWSARDSSIAKHSGCGACAENHRSPSRTQGVPRVLVCIEGLGQIEYGGDAYTVGRGEVWLLPAVIGVVRVSARQSSEFVGNRSTGVDPAVQPRSIRGFGRLQGQQVSGMDRE